MLVELLLWTGLGLYGCCAVALALYGLNCYAMMVLFVRARERQAVEDREVLERLAREHTDADLPRVTTQLPIYNEKFVVERLLEAVCAFDYPKDKHEIQVLDDSTDETRQIVAARVAKLRRAGYDVHHIHRSRRVGYKAGALAAGMRVARGEHIAIFDADFVPPPDFLRRTVPFLMEDPGCGFVQTRWGHRNRGFSLLTMAQSIGIDGHFVVEQSARAWNGLFLNFNGTAGLWRREAIERAGGWQSDTITEDLDLSYRAQLCGYRGRFLFDAVTPAEIPTDINAFKSQQHRWAQGSIQTARKLLPAILRRSDVGRFKKLQAVLHLTHYLVHPTILLMTLLVLPLLIWGQRIFTAGVMIPLLVVMLVSLLAPSSLYVFSQRMTHARWKGQIKYLPVLMVLGMGLAVNNTRGVLQALLGRGHGEFVRTPKLGRLAERRDSGVATARPQNKKPKSRPATYRVPLSGLCLLEILMGLWACGAFAQYVSTYRFLVGPILLLHALGFFYVGLSSFVHDRRARHQARASDRQPTASTPARGYPGQAAGVLELPSQLPSRASGSFEPDLRSAQRSRTSAR